jgi:hypothetical protein
MLQSAPPLSNNPLQLCLSEVGRGRWLFVLGQDLLEEGAAGLGPVAAGEGGRGGRGRGRRVVVVVVQD